MKLVIAEKSYHYQASLARLWPLLSDSSLMTELDGQPAYEAVDELQPDGTILRRAKGRFVLPMAAEWTEDLGEWVEHRYLRQLRQFTKGGFRHVDFVSRIEATGDGFVIHMSIEMLPRGLVGWVGGALGLMRRGALKFIASTDWIIQRELALPASEEQADTMQSTSFAPTIGSRPCRDRGVTGPWRPERATGRLSVRHPQYLAATYPAVDAGAAMAG